MPRAWTGTRSVKVRSANYWLAGQTKLEGIIRGKQAKKERQDTKIYVLSTEMLNRAKPKLPLRITMTRISPCRYDADNLGPQGAFKHVQDGIADALGVNDGDPRIEWKCGQERGGVREYGLRILIEELGAEGEAK